MLVKFMDHGCQVQPRWTMQNENLVTQHPGRMTSKRQWFCGQSPKVFKGLGPVLDQHCCSCFTQALPCSYDHFSPWWFNSEGVLPNLKLSMMQNS